MNGRHAERKVLGALLVFGGLSALAGMVGLLGGGLKLADGVLDGTPFPDYTIPALILGIIVGGSQLAAWVALVRQVDKAMLAAGASGCVMVGWIAGEVLLLGSDPGVMLALQGIYLTVGVLEAGLAARLLRPHAHQTAQP